MVELTDAYTGLVIAIQPDQIEGYTGSLIYSDNGPSKIRVCDQDGVVMQYVVKESVMQITELLKHYFEGSLSART